MFISSFHRFRTAILLVDSSHHFVSSSRVILSIRFVGWLLRPLTSSTRHWPHWFSVVCHFDVLSFRYGICRLNLFTKAPSTHIWICLNPQLFLSGFKISLSTRWIEFACPHASDQENMNMVSCPMASEFTLVPSAPLQLNVFRARAIKHVVVAENLLCFCCAAILVYRSVRD